MDGFTLLLLIFGSIYAVLTVFLTDLHCFNLLLDGFTVAIFTDSGMDLRSLNLFWTDLHYLTDFWIDLHCFDCFLTDLHCFNWFLDGCTLFWLFLDGFTLFSRTFGWIYTVFTTPQRGVLRTPRPGASGLCPSARSRVPSPRGE